MKGLPAPLPPGSPTMFSFMQEQKKLFCTALLSSGCVGFTFFHRLGGFVSLKPTHFFLTAFCVSKLGASFVISRRFVEQAQVLRRRFFWLKKKLPVP